MLLSVDHRSIAVTVAEGAEVCVDCRCAVRRVASASALFARSFANNPTSKIAIGVVPPGWVSVVEANDEARLVPFTLLVPSRVWFVNLGTLLLCLGFTLGPVLVADVGAVGPAEAVARTLDSDGGVVSNDASPESVAVVSHRVEDVLCFLFRSDRCNFAFTIGAELDCVCVVVPERVRVVFELPLARWMVPFSDSFRLAHNEFEGDAILLSHNHLGGTASKD